MKKWFRTCTTCGKQEEIFGKSLICNDCSHTAKRVATIEKQRQHLTELNFTNLEYIGPCEHGHNKWRLTPACCGRPFISVYGNVLKQVKHNEKTGHQHCASCGPDRRMSAAMSAYMQKYGRTDYELSLYDEYKKKVMSFSAKEYTVWKHVINPHNLPRGRGKDKFHVDHIVPIIWCFNYGILPEIAGHHKNLQMLSSFENISKGGKVIDDTVAYDILFDNNQWISLIKHLDDNALDKISIVPDTMNVWNSSNKLIIRHRELQTSLAAVISRVQYHLGKCNRKYGARNLHVKLITKQDECNFLTQWHVQGYEPSTYALGLFAGDELLSIMSFCVPRYKQKHASWELLRFCSKGGVAVSGGASKLWNFFLKEKIPNAVVSYSLNRWGDGNMYRTLGFTKTSTQAGASYVFLHDGVQRQWRNAILYAKRHGIPHSSKGIEGAVKVDDPGTTTWHWTK